MIVIETEYRTLLIEYSGFCSSFLEKKQSIVYVSVKRKNIYLLTLTLQVMALLMKKYIAAPQETDAMAM